MLAASLVLAAGCSKSPEDQPVPPGVMANPSGKPQNAEQVAQLDERQKAGQAAVARMAEQAKEIKEAKDRTGGK